MGRDVSESNPGREVVRDTSTHGCSIVKSPDWTRRREWPPSRRARARGTEAGIGSSIRTGFPFLTSQSRVRSGSRTEHAFQPPLGRVRSGFRTYLDPQTGKLEFGPDLGHNPLHTDLDVEFGPSYTCPQTLLRLTMAAARRRRSGCDPRGYGSGRGCRCRGQLRCPQQLGRRLRRRPHPLGQLAPPPVHRLHSRYYCICVDEKGIQEGERPRNPGFRNSRTGRPSRVASSCR
jgi:hypothetical protein